MTRTGQVEHDFLAALYRALRTIQAGREVGGSRRAALDQLRASCDPLLDAERRLAVRLVRDAIYLNDTCLAPDVQNFVFHAHVLRTLRGAGIGTLLIRGIPTRRDLQVVLSLVVRLSDPGSDTSRIERLRATIEAQRVRTIEVIPPRLAGTGGPDEEARRSAAKRAYDDSVEVSRELFEGTRKGRRSSVPGVRHTVRDIVDGVLTDEASLGALSALKDLDAYTFTHAVNVCIFAVAIGRRLGLSKSQLYDLGHAALVHDVGMSRIPPEILSKESTLTEDERVAMEAHTWMGALRIFELRDFGDVPLQSMLVAYEHHMRPDGRGYPDPTRPRSPTLFSRIVAVAAAFDAATNERAHAPARPPDEVLREFRENPELGFDVVVVKALAQALGLYPAGTCVVLDTREVALVHSANPDPTFAARPVVRLLTDPEGRWREEPPLADLADTDETGRHPRSIVRTVDAGRYGIRVSDYLV